MLGIEPRTYGLRNRCSTTELHRQNLTDVGTYATSSTFVNGPQDHRKTTRLLSPSTMGGHVYHSAPLSGQVHCQLGIT